MDLGNPSSYLALEPGTEVVSSDGQRVGTVQHVLADEREDVFDGLVIDVEGSTHFADADQVDGVYERAVILKLSAAEVGSLPKPTPSPGVIESHGVEDSESALTSKLHRAWDRITGNY